jgi:hypothetical protein
MIRGAFCDGGEDGAGRVFAWLNEVLAQRAGD